MFELTKLQQKHLDAITWLLSEDYDDLRSGRTYLLAYCFVRKAISRPRHVVKVFDHHPFYRTVPFMIGTIKYIIAEISRDLPDDVAGKFMRSFRWTKDTLCYDSDHDPFKPKTKTETINFLKEEGRRWRR